MTELLLLALGLAIAAAVAAVAWRGERARRVALDFEAEELREAAIAARRDAEAKTETKRARGDELVELRQRLDKAKRRAFTAQEEKAPLEARIAALETELGDRERETKRLRDDLARLEGEVEMANRDKTRLRDETQRAVEAREAAARVPRVDPEEQRSLAHRADAAEEEVRRLNGQLREIERDAMRYRQRERTHRRLYMVIRGELGAAQDRIRQLTGAPPGEAFVEPDDPSDRAS
jgi:chromosome segregation protein